MQVLEAKTALKRYGFDDSDPLLVWLNAGRHEVIDDHDWSWARTISTGNLLSGSILTLPTDCAVVETVTVITDAQSIKLSPVSYQYFVDHYDTVAGGQGIPVVYAPYEAGQVIVAPAPDLAYTFNISYTREFVDLTNDSDPLGLPDNLSYAVVLTAAYIALQAENEEERAGTAQAQAGSRIAAAFTKDSRASGGGADDMDQVEDVQGYSWQ